MLQLKYLGVIFTAHTCISLTFGPLKRNMSAAWALLKRQYGRLQCLSSVGLLFRLYMVCVPSTASYGCEIWGLSRLPASAATARQPLSQSHLHMVKEISGVRKCTPTPILLAEFGLKSMPRSMVIACGGLLELVFFGLPSRGQCVPTCCFRCMLSSHFPRSIGHIPYLRQSGALGISSSLGVITSTRLTVLHWRLC